jgi:Tfp pilus assembly PilM family ATPase
MDTIKIYFQKVLSFLRIRATAAGLEISDQVLRVVYLSKKAWQMEAIRLAPGIMEKGKIKDAEAFAGALRELKAKIATAKGKKKLNVVVSLSSVGIYSQVFTLPIMEGTDLDKAIDLNVQMASPIDTKQAYFGWQILGRDEVNLRSEISAAFVDRTVVDDITQALYTAGFITVGVESRALALVRVLREKGVGVDIEKSYLLLAIDNIGIDFLIVRNGKLYFEYANLWSDIADDKGEITVEKFEETLESSLRQVMNFYTQHWPEPLTAVILSAAAFKDEAEKSVTTALSLPVVPLTFNLNQAVSPEWFIAFGCALRGLNANDVSSEINLSGEGAMDMFHEEQLVDFFTLWQILLPSVLGFLVILLVLTVNFLNVTRTNIESQPAFNQHGVEIKEVAALTASSTAFNQSVALVANAEGQISKNYLLITTLNSLAAANSVDINSISFQATSTPILVAGVSHSPTQIAAFKDAIEHDPHFGTVTLPLLNIQQNGAGGYSFSMSFPLSSTGL